MSKIIVALKILTNVKFYWFVISDLFGYFSKIVRRYEMLVNRGNIRLGNHTYIDQSTDLLAPIGTNISVGDRTTINGHCVILGDVIIESDCLLSYNIYISSGNHQIALVPEWLIHDQDDLYKSTPDPKEYSSQVHIEEDCWIGWGVFIKQGIYIGRGAVIGASAVVSRDVPPYSIQVGIPNREISQRLNFDPPSHLEATNKNDLPYFYCGFSLRQCEIAKSKLFGILTAKKNVRLMMKGGDFNHMDLTGRLTDGLKKIKLSLKCNGFKIGEGVIDSVDFKISFDNIKFKHNENSCKSKVLNQFNEIEITAFEIDNVGDLVNSFKLEYLYGIRSISLS